MESAAAVKVSWRDLFAFTRWTHCVALVPAVIASCAIGAFKTSLAVTLGLFFQYTVDVADGSVGGPETIKRTAALSVILCGLGAGHWAANTAFFASWVLFGELQARSTREQLFKSLLKQDMSWYDSQSEGVSSLLVRIESQTRELQIATSQVLGFLISDIVVSVACLIVSFYMSWKLTLVLLATVPISIVALTLATRRLQSAIQLQKAHLSQATKYANSSITGIDLVKIYNGFDTEVWHYLNSINASMKQYLVQAHCNAVQMGYAKFWVVSLFAVGFWYGIVLVQEGASPAQILTTFYATLTALQGIENLMPQWLVLAKGMAAGQSLRQTGAYVNRGKKRVGTHKPSCCIGDIEVNDVSFAYPSNPDQIVLQKSSFRFRAGETCFIVGKSGSGKSTLGNLLVNFYEPLTGTVLVDHHLLQDLDDEWIRRNITLIQQTSVLFNETFFRNVAFGHPSPDDVTLDEVRSACDTAILQSTIAAMHQGLDTPVGTGGYSLSGGQKQRIALARARLRDPSILILDEVTSGLDLVSKTLVMEAIRVWRRDKTTIIITHDVSQIKDDDYVFVMEKSRLVQEGYRRDISVDEGGFFAALLSALHDEDIESEGSADIPSPLQESFTDNESSLVSNPRESSFVGKMIMRELDQAFERPDTGHSSRPFSLGHGTTRATELRMTRIWDTPSRSRMRFSRGLSWHVADGEASVLDENRKGAVKARARPMSSGYDETTSSWRHSLDLVQMAGVNIQHLRIGTPASRQSWRQTSHPLPPDKKAFDTRCGPEAARPNMVMADTQQNVLPNPSSIALSRSVWAQLSNPDRLKLLSGIILCIVVAVSGPLFAFALTRLLETFWADEDVQRSVGQKWAVVMVAVAVIDGLSTWLGRYLMEFSGQAWVNALRIEALKRILQQPRLWFDKPKHSAGRITECMDRNAEEMRNIVGRFAPIIIVVTFMVLTAFIWALLVQWKLTLVALSGGPAIMATVKAFSYTSTKWETTCNQGAADTSAVLAETFNNIRVVKNLTLEAYMSKKYNKSAESTFKLGIRRAAYTSPLFGLYQAVNFFLLALVFYYAMVLVGTYEAGTAQIQQVSNLVLFTMGQAGSLLGTIPQLAAARATAAQMLYYAALPIHSSDEEDLDTGLGKLASPLPIKMANLNFTYPSRPAHQVLRNLSLEIKASTCTAIALLDIDQHHLRSAMAFVPQAPFLFPASIAENIAYGLPDASPLRSQASLDHAARAAGIHDFVISLPGGYSTLIGEGGTDSLGEGRPQRVCIARALARRPKLLVMDEPTSALDAETAEMVKGTIRGLIAEAGEFGMAVVIVTHAREMMQLAERILVLEDGSVVEEGTCEELRGRNGAFTRLVGVRRPTLRGGSRDDNQT
ncbi:multidrug resistance protein [Verticillium alfalfae VaMs.102]|uniref:Multidrug resistance protein n=1 Tax=Verticillium alfalfae (strain VaMs.102 / ATCC MYA-4576 / FGSC 10136) TaxID=526221 RepID=C9SF78_VERA1|nr:multidrug resistance protein [Verticillium alfalfae VaMs.102]EEY17864.1 multidrug resistance protein [Verticillium alfalfae VaMs.102]